MMRHDQREGSPIAIDIPMGQLTPRRRNDVIKVIGDVWRHKNWVPVTPPRSPISKAFDFFPWSRNKRNMEKLSKTDKRDENQNQNVLQNEGTISRGNTTDTNAVRVLSDNSNRNKAPNKNDLIHRHNTLSSHKKGRRLSRNKSLDIDELIEKAEEREREKESQYKNSTEMSNPWDENKKFLDDTFIENIMKRTKNVTDENAAPRNHNPNSKHILFNDENTVYLIKKDKSINRHLESLKDKKSLGIGLKNSRNMNNNIYNKLTEDGRNNNSACVDGSVIKARLKFKKVSSQDDSDIDIGKSPAKSRPGILYRHNSIDSAPSHARSKSPETISDGSADGNYKAERLKSTKPRKKLSFRDPVVFPRRVMDRREKNQLASTDNENGKQEFRFDDSELESQAMRIVRTVGQAFEVCHKFNLQKNSLDNNDDRSDHSSDLLEQDRISEQLTDDDDERKKDSIPISSDQHTPQRPNHLDIMPQPNSNFRKSPCSDGDKSPTSPISTAREIQQLKDKLEQQALQTKQALGQLMLVREQLMSETNARIEAQARTQQLLQQNRELLEHLASLGGYTEPDRTGLTSANIGLAPQSQLQILLQDQTDLSPIRKAFMSTTNQNNLTAINQQLNNLGSINQQLNTLTHQLSGLNQQSQNLQNLQNIANVTIPPLNVFPTFNQVPKLNNQLPNISPTTPEILSQQELYQVNQELLNRLQSLNLTLTTSPTNNNGQAINNNNNSPQNSFIFANPGQLSSSPSNNNNFNFLNSPTTMGNLTPSPIGSLNRNSYSNSPMDNNLGLSIDKNLNDIEDGHLIKPLSQVGTLTTLDSDGKVKVIVPISTNNNSDTRQDAMSASSSSSRRHDRKMISNVPNIVTLKVTDETGVVTNSRKLSATPSFITRSTSEKVPNRSQMMSQVQRTTWARHTTK